MVSLHCTKNINKFLYDGRFFVRIFLQGTKKNILRILPDLTSLKTTPIFQTFYIPRSKNQNQKKTKRQPTKKSYGKTK